MAKFETLHFSKMCNFCRGISAYLPIVVVINGISTRELLGENKSDFTDNFKLSDKLDCPCLVYIYTNDLKYLDSFQLQKVCK